MELLIIFILLVIIGIMYSNKQEADDSERERIDPGFLKRRDLKNRIVARLALMADEQNRRVDNAIKKGEKISFWTHIHPKKSGHYQVEYQNDDLLLRKDSDYDILFYQSVLYADEWGNYTYDDAHIYPKLLRTTAYWDGFRYDVKNVRYYLFEMK